MSTDPALEYARQVYKDIYKELKKDKPKKGGKPSLVVVGEEHGDIPRLKEFEPARQATYAEVSALAAAKSITCEEQVILSVELDAFHLAAAMWNIKNNWDSLPEEIQQSSISHAIKYAIENNIEIVPSDPLFSASINGKLKDPEDREQAQQQAIKKHSEKYPGHYIIHVGGAGHIANLQGYTDERIIETGGNIKAKKRDNPFKNDFARKLYINAAHYSTVEISLVHRAMQKNEDAEQHGREILSDFNYRSQRRNALQINPPKEAEIVSASKMSQLVQQAAWEHENKQKLSDYNPSKQFKVDTPCN